MGAGEDTRSAELARFLSYVAKDPTNLSLLRATADRAYAEGDLRVAQEMIGRCEDLGPLPKDLANLQGLIAMSEVRWADAVLIFEPLVAKDPHDDALGANLARCLAMVGDFAGADAHLSEPAVFGVAGAAALKLRALHHLGRLDEGVALGRRLFASPPPEDPKLWGTLAVLALDAEAEDLAEQAALRGPNTDDALATLGMLKLGRDDFTEGQAAFTSALTINPASARALLGKGLSLLAEGQVEAAGPWLDRAAETFKTHLGTWVAAGWVRYLCGDMDGARARFEAGLAIDDTFAELHGGLAVVALAQGHLAEAKRCAEIALRLDRHAFAGALAQSLLLAGSGATDAALRIQTLALNTTVGPSGTTLAQALARTALRNKRPEAGAA